MGWYQSLVVTYHSGMETVPSLRATDTYLLSRVGKAGRRRMVDRLAGIGFSLRHMAVLGYLADRGPAAQRDIGRLLGIDPSDLVGALDELEDRGLVRRERDPDDRRRHRVSLTPAGRTALRRCRRHAAAVDDEVLAPLTAAQRRILSDLLGRVFDALDADVSRPAAPAPTPGTRTRRR